MNQRALGLIALVADVIEHGATAIEDVHLTTTGRVFDLLEALPPMTRPVSLVHTIHDLGVRTTYATVRQIDRLLSRTLTMALRHVPAGTRPVGP